MKSRWYRLSAIVFTGMAFAFLPGCVEVWVLNLATPFLLAH